MPYQNEGLRRRSSSFTCGFNFKTLAAIAICWSVGIVICFSYFSHDLDELSEHENQQENRKRDPSALAQRRRSRSAVAKAKKRKSKDKEQEISMSRLAERLQEELKRNAEAKQIEEAAHDRRDNRGFYEKPANDRRENRGFVEKPAVQCRYEFHADMYIGEWANPYDRAEKPLNEAKKTCDGISFLCKGVTCSDASEMKCTARRGVPPLAPSEGGEVSYAKVCDDDPVPPSFFLPGSSDGPLSSEADTAFRRRPETRNSAVVIIEHDRAEYLRLCLASLLKLEGASSFAFYVSLDDPAAFENMTRVVQLYEHQRPIKIFKKPPSSRLIGLGTGKALPSENIAAHFGFALRQVFEVERHEFAIFLEADLLVAPDFFTYFQNTMWLLEADPTLWCVSAWNDNGFAEVVSNERRLLRTSYFPGLGWMIRNNTWAQLHSVWPLHPTTGWDHWIRHGSGNVDRDCIMPEVSRTHHIATHGTNVKKAKEVNMYKRMALSKLPAGNLGDLSYLLKENYDAQLKRVLEGMRLLSGPPLIAQGLDLKKQYIIPFAIEEYKLIALIYDLYPANFRGYYNGVLLTRDPTTGATVALIDRRKGGRYLPPSEAWTQEEGDSIITSQVGENCNSACLKIQKRCNEKDLVFINTCKVMQANFPCASGCGHEMGDDIPCQVSGASGIKTAGMCLVSDMAPKCGAANKNTARLCACSDLQQEDPPQPQDQQQEDLSQEDLQQLLEALR